MVVAFISAAHNLIMTAGVWSYYARLAGYYGACLMSCLNLAIIITIGVFRFNTWGDFSALSLELSQYADTTGSGIEESLRLYDGYTYKSAATFITTLFAFSIVLCIGSFVGIQILLTPTKK